MMTIAAVQKAPNSVAPAEGFFVTTLAATFDAQPAAGNLIAAMVATDVAPTGLSDNASGNTYTLAGTTSITGAIASMYYAKNIATVAGFAVTATFPSGSNCSLGAVEVFGADTVAPVGGTAANSGVASTAVSTGPIAAGSRAGIYIGHFTLSPGVGTSSCSFDYDQVHDEHFDLGAPMMSEYTRGVGAKNLTWTQGSAVDWVALGALLMEPPNPADVILSDPTVLRSTGGTAFQQILTEQIPFLDVVTRNITKLLSETLGLADQASRNTVRIVTEALPLIDTVTRQKIVTLAESLVLADAVSKNTVRALIEAITLADVRTATLTRTIANAIAAVDTTARITTRPLVEQLALAQVFSANQIKVLTEQVALVGTSNQNLTRALAEAVALADTLAKVTTRPIAEQVALVDTIFASKVTTKILTEQLALVDTVNKTLTRALTQTVTLVDGRTVSVQHVLAEAVALGDTKAATLTRQLTEVVALNDTIVALKVFFKELLETVTLAQPAPVRQIVKTLTETVGLVDTRSATLTRLLNETATLVANATKQVTKAPLVEAATLVAAVTKVATKPLNQAVALVDSFGRELDSVRVLVEGLALEDVVRKHIVRVLTEAMALADSATAGAAYSPVGRLDGPYDVFLAASRNETILTPSAGEVFLTPSQNATGLTLSANSTELREIWP